MGAGFCKYTVDYFRSDLFSAHFYVFASFQNSDPGSDNSDSSDSDFEPEKEVQ